MKIPVGFAQVNIRFTGAALPTGAEVVFGVQHIGSAYASPADVANRVRTHWTDSTIMTNIVSTVATSSVLVKFGPNETGPAAELAFPLAGTGGTNATPPNTAFLVRKNTAFGGRAARGRMYLPGVREGSITDAGQIDGALVSALQADLDSFFGKMDADDLPLMLLHAPATTLFDDPLPITSLSLQGYVATQRRRLRR